MLDLHVPYSLEPETDLDDALRSWLAFGAEKVREVVVLARALRDGHDAVADEIASSRAAIASRKRDPRLHNGQIRARIEAIVASGAHRGNAAQRRASQDARLHLPPLPTTTIGSYPQTSAIRVARAALRAGEIDEAEYVRRMRQEITEVIALQERLRIDVLVHGEPERNDMVQYFAEQLAGFFATQNGWVQSYGSRCVRPPILYGDVSRPRAMTVEWITYAQSLTDKPVKGMLTGPVTILAWSFVRDDQPLADTANQVALAIRDETVDLQSAGIAVIQVDEPALRELLPLRRADQAEYLRWAVGAFRLATSGVSDATQIHTHLCYSEFGEVIGAIADLDADVTSIEAARSHMEGHAEAAIGFANGVGPGVYDIHSPRVPSAEEMADSLRAALRAVPAERLWVNPDCGLKTRNVDEVTASLHNMVAAAREVRAGLADERQQLVDRHVVVPGLPVHHVGHPDIAALELPGRRVYQPVLLGLPMDGLRVEQHHPHLTGLEAAPLLHRRDQLLVVQVAVAEVPADGSAADPFAVGDDVVVFVMAGHRPMRQRK
ncbi:5-methyltetrahydropteroyltriglutamate--homocysteine S-methyltransferase [Mycobacterium tuberculosis CAS/NITR204]|uniref:5-methyltetrahydropteroyltriglutamate--homocysteine S-methyltransferase n=2 Tax=Mycobacterium tuberculosis TaxID=1773 RepID=R4MC04_MYCTX|nr:5-methyltetrahydropteroyltriglutamate--homocysteine S-methyltransferase [Mycobacterium tuberculosis CAS/NITR204]